jgi:hypothetical protein
MFPSIALLTVTDLILAQTSASLFADDYDEAVSRRLQAGAGVPAITSALAVGRAVRALGAQRIAIVAIYGRREHACRGLFRGEARPPDRCRVRLSAEQMPRVSDEGTRCGRGYQHQTINPELSQTRPFQPSVVEPARLQTGEHRDK